MPDESEIRDIHDFIEVRVAEADLNPEISPEASHNAIVKACSDYIVSANHDNVQDYEYHYITAVRIADQIYASHRKYTTHTEELLSSADDIPVPDETIVDFADRSARFTIGNTIMLIYSMSYEFVNDMLSELIGDVIRDDVPESGKNAIRSQIGSYRGRADTLVACDVIDSDQQEVIKHISDVRRDLVHDVEERFTLSVLDDLNKINRIPHLLNELYEMVYNQPAFHYYDDLEPDDLIEDS